MKESRAIKALQCNPSTVTLGEGYLSVGGFDTNSSNFLLEFLQSNGISFFESPSFRVLELLVQDEADQNSGIDGIRMFLGESEPYIALSLLKSHRLGADAPWVLSECFLCCGKPFVNPAPQSGSPYNYPPRKSLLSCEECAKDEVEVAERKESQEVRLKGMFNPLEDVSLNAFTHGLTMRLNTLVPTDILQLTLDSSDFLHWILELLPQLQKAENSLWCT